MNIDVMAIIFASVIVPLLTGIAVKFSWSSNLKNYVATCLCLVAAGVVYVMNNGLALDPTTILVTLTGILVLSQTLYDRVFKPLGVTAFLQKKVGLTD